MLGRQERIALILLIGVAITVVAAHTVLSIIGKQPFAHPYTENSPDGDLVLVEGIITKAALIENGGHLALVVNNTSIFVPASVAQGIVVHKGDTMVAYGIVQTYRGEKEIVISSAEDLRITTIP
jgi:DNA/RNA endonuclease YhcR with UshA esterase domain